MRCKFLSLYFSISLLIGGMVLWGPVGCGSNLENETFNVYIYPQDAKEEYLGEVKGIGACREKAATRAIYINLKKGEWDYVCCLKTKDSDCAKKHK